MPRLRGVTVIAVGDLTVLIGGLMRGCLGDVSDQSWFVKLVDDRLPYSVSTFVTIICVAG